MVLQFLLESSDTEGRYRGIFPLTHTLEMLYVGSEVRLDPGFFNLVKRI